MLTITEDDAHGCFVLEPVGQPAQGRPRRADRALRRQGRRGATGSRTSSSSRRAFPTWSNFAALLEHLRFIRDHHRQIEKVALVSDARALDIAPRIARLFVSARLRHFPADALDEALAWVAERGDEPPAT